MAIELCIEGSGWMLHAIDGGASNMMTALRQFLPFAPRSTVVNAPADRAEQTRRAAAELPIDQARAIWLVDVCGYCYADAAAVIDDDLETVAALVGHGRQAIRRQVYGEPKPCDGPREPRTPE